VLQAKRAEMGGSLMIRNETISRRKALALGTAATVLPLIHIRTGRAAGKVTVGFWDHWAPEGNDIMRKQCAEFAKANNVEVVADFITSIGSKLDFGHFRASPK
jgi:ABC-type glycerol-3-phosphate transport system substrate-binding protein